MLTISWNEISNQEKFYIEHPKTAIRILAVKFKEVMKKLEKLGWKWCTGHLPTQHTPIWVSNLAAGYIYPDKDGFSQCSFLVDGWNECELCDEPSVFKQPDNVHLYCNCEIPKISKRFAGGWYLYCHQCMKERNAE